MLTEHVVWTAAITSHGPLQWIRVSETRSGRPDDAGGSRLVPWNAFWPQRARPRINAAVSAALSGRSGHFIECVQSAVTTGRWWDVAISRANDGVDGASRLIAFARDVTDYKQAIVKLERSSSHDSLTGVANRRTFYEELEATLAAAQQSTTAFAVVMIDVDRFKHINDSAGHCGGDSLLQTVAARLSMGCRSCDLVARLGGDEFALILQGLPHAKTALSTARSVVERLSKPFIYAGRSFDCSASAGIAVYPEHGRTADELCQHADAALYAAKAAGRGRLVAFDGELRDALEDQRAMLDRAREAIGAKRILPHYQPKIDLRTGRIVGLEALLRWRSAAGSLEFPASIAAAFDDPDLACKITDIMIGKTIADMRRWRAQGLYQPVAVNITEADLRQAGFGDALLRRLSRAGIPANQFEIEITETAFLGRDPDRMARMLKAMSDAGIRITLDDFGTGYASLSHLKQFPVDVIKIDRSFVTELRNDPGDRAIVEAMLKLASSLLIDVVAEGVETIADAELLRDLGCGFGQGYLFHKAMSAQQIRNLLKQGNLVNTALLDTTQCHKTRKRNGENAPRVIAVCQPQPH